MKFSKLIKPELEKIIENANFTEEEETIFKDLSKGISQKEIAFRHSVSLSTVERRTRAIKEKVNKIGGDIHASF